MTPNTVIGFTTDQLVAVMGDAGIHCSLDRFKRLAIAIQQAALDEQRRAIAAVAEKQTEEQA